MSRAVITIEGIEGKHINRMREVLEAMGLRVVDMRLFPDGADEK